MKIRKLEIVGFKSFLDKAAISFPPGISAIVGPNGCGKSNVIDALRWVMGEQSVKQLRGKAMEDIIFSGANGKAPLNMAEVTLTMTNDNGHAPEEFRDYAEISVTRRLFRSGESAYLINKQPCRLKDIYNLFMGSGVGSRTFAIIQQGNIGAIIDAGPDERRLFLEEAAGVTRYKLRKNEALRKVKSTEQNMLRLNDIISEVNRQMAGLQRQAKKAEQYKQYQERITVIDTRLLLHQFDDFSSQINKTEHLLKNLKDKDIEHLTQMKKIDAAVEHIKLTRWQKNQEISAHKNERFETQRNIDQLEAERKHLREEGERLVREADALEGSKTDLQSKTVNIATEVTQVSSQNEHLSSQINEIKLQINSQRTHVEQFQKELGTLNQNLENSKNRLMQLIADEAKYKNIYQNASANKENVQRRLKRVDEQVAMADKKVEAIEKENDAANQELQTINEEIKELQTQINTLKNSLDEESKRLGESVKTAHTLELERSKVRSQLSTLKKMAENYEWYRDGVKAVMRAARNVAGQNDSIASENQQATALPSPQLQGVQGLMADILDPDPGFADALEAVLGDALQYIIVEDQTAGSMAIDFLQNTNAGRCGFIPVPSIKRLTGTDSPNNHIENKLLDHVTVPDAFSPIAQALLGHVAVVPTLAEAFALFNKNGRIQTIASQSGEVITHQGVVLGGSREQLSGILSKKQELKSLNDQCETLDRQLLQAQNLQKELEKSVRNLESNLQQSLSEKSQLADQATEMEKKCYRLGEDLKSGLRHKEIVELEQEQLLGEETDIDEEMSNYYQALNKIQEEVQQARQETDTTSQQIGQISSKWETYNQQVVDLKLSLTAMNAKYENGLNTLQRLKEFEKDSRERLEQLTRDIEVKREKQIAAASKLAGDEVTLRRHYDSLKQLEEKLSEKETDYNVIDKTLQENDEQLNVIKTERDNTLEKTRLVELDLSENRIKRENIVGKVRERYHGTIADLRAQQFDDDNTLQMSITEMEAELDRHRSRLAAIGSVNMDAIKEYEELKERFDFLSTQRDDLLKAIEDLNRVIRKINKITQQRFMETYENVNLKLQEVFPKLFNGGSARLELSEPSKPLETGVEYLVHPPGKKLTRMSLLSGGEKALSAIAFIFAIFMLRPASFCLLDEIDAPLDESNVVRFNNLMQVVGAKSQIVMITHNKKSMEFAEKLYGVTMEQKGISKIVSVNLSGKAA